MLLARRIAGEQPRTARHLADLDRLRPPNVGRELALFDSAVLRVVPDSAHQITLDRPDLLAAAVREVAVERAGADLAEPPTGTPGP